MKNQAWLQENAKTTRHVEILLLHGLYSQNALLVLLHLKLLIQSVRLVDLHGYEVIPGFYFTNSSLPCDLLAAASFPCHAEDLCHLKLPLAPLSQDPAFGCVLWFSFSTALSLLPWKGSSFTLWRSVLPGGFYYSCGLSSFKWLPAKGEGVDL